MVELIAVSEKRAAARRQGGKELATVLRVFLKEVDFAGFRVVL